MSPVGQKRTFAPQKVMSALPPESGHSSARAACRLSRKAPRGCVHPDRKRKGRQADGRLETLVSTEWSRQNSISFMRGQSAHRHLQVISFLFHTDTAQFTN